MERRIITIEEIAKSVSSICIHSSPNNKEHLIKPIYKLDGIDAKFPRSQGMFLFRNSNFQLDNIMIVDCYIYLDNAKIFLNHSSFISNIIQYINTNKKLVFMDYGSQKNSIFSMTSSSIVTGCTIRACEDSAFSLLNDILIPIE